MFLELPDQRGIPIPSGDQGDILILRNPMKSMDKTFQPLVSGYVAQREVDEVR
jgi:hypothetical protein